MCQRVHDLATGVDSGVPVLECPKAPPGVLMWINSNYYWGPADYEHMKVYLANTDNTAISAGPLPC